MHYEQARDLVDAVYRISGRPVALFLDQFEEALDPGLEVKRLRAFLRDAGDWPACHIFVALQPKEHAIGPITELTRAFQGPARAHRLGPLDLDDTAARDGGLLSFLNWRVPAVRGLPEEQILASIDGYPGVIYQWTSDYQREAMRSVEDLERVAADAHAYRFGELDTLLPTLQGEARRLAARLALLPLAADPEAWDEIKPQVCDGLNPEMLDDLRLNRVLESADPPSFGHAKRWEAALTWFVKNRKNTIKPEAEALILAFASRVRDASANASAPTMALIVIGTTSGGRDLPDLHRAVCEAAMTLFRLPGDAHAILRGAQTARTEARAAPLIAMSLFNTLIDAKAESDFRLRDTLLAEMRALAQAHSKDASVRNMLTRVLFNTLIDASPDYASRLAGVA